MASRNLYISPEFNPHSLERDWGFFVRKQRPRIYEAMADGYESLRSALIADAMSFSGSTALSISGKVGIESLPATPSILYQEVGLDVLALALLADVPMHRPLRLTPDSLLGHWRWLRAVWRKCGAFSAQLSDNATAKQSGNTDPAIVAALRKGQNNRAVALLRQGFWQIDAKTNGSPTGEAQSFLANLALFCPFIATELRYRHGLIPAFKAEGYPR